MSLLNTLQTRRKTAIISWYISLNINPPMHRDPYINPGNCFLYSKPLWYVKSLVFKGHAPSKQPPLLSPMEQLRTHSFTCKFWVYSTNRPFSYFTFIYTHTCTCHQQVSLSLYKWKCQVSKRTKASLSVGAISCIPLLRGVGRGTQAPVSLTPRTC